MDVEQLGEILGIKFSDEQKTAICAPLAPGVIIAGAGSGKTTVMAARVVWLVANQLVTPAEVLGLTFTVKATSQLFDKIFSALLAAGVISADEVDLPTIATYDSFAGQIANQYGAMVGVGNDTRLITDVTATQLARRIIENTVFSLPNLSQYSINSLTSSVISFENDLVSHLKTVDKVRQYTKEWMAQLQQAPFDGKGRYAVGDTEKALEAHQKRLELLDLVELFQAEKKRRSLVSFADQTALAAKIAAEIEIAGADIRQQFKVVLLDEYQDTSNAQVKVLVDLFAKNSPGFPITAVGDPMQAIYGWRGASASNIVQFANQFPNQDFTPAKVYNLSLAMRSGKAILDVANQIAKPMHNWLAERGIAQKQLSPGKHQPAKLLSAKFTHQDDELVWLVNQIAAIGNESQNWAEIAVLGRKNDLLIKIYELLTAADIPAEIVGLGGLLKIPEVAQIVQTMKILADPLDNQAVVNLLANKRWQFGSDSLALIAARAKWEAKKYQQLALQHSTGQDGDAKETKAADSPLVISWLATITGNDLSWAPQNIREKLAKLAAELTHLRRYLNEPVGSLVARIIDSQGVEVELKSQGDWGMDRLRQVDRFVEIVANYQGLETQTSLGDVIEYLDLEAQDTGLERDNSVTPNAVQLLTVHKSKGLEWDYVFMPSLADKIFPATAKDANYATSYATFPAPLRADADAVPQLKKISYQGLKDYPDEIAKDQIRSESRLAYVGVTRAKRQLFVSYHEKSDGLVRPRTPSQFFGAVKKFTAQFEDCQAEEQLVDTATEVNRLDSGTPVSSAEPEKQPAGEKFFRWPVPTDPQRLAELYQAKSAVDVFLVEAAKAESLEADQSNPPATNRAVARSVSDFEVKTQVRLWKEIAENLVRQKMADRIARTDQLPKSLSATQTMALLEKPETFLASLRRPMPQISSRSSLVGTAFHQWIEHYYRQNLLIAGEDQDFDAGLVNKADLQWLAKLIKVFKNSKYAALTPLAIEQPFACKLGDRVIKGCIDAVFPATGRYQYQIVDWKIYERKPNPIQLSIYRLAWVEATGCSWDQVETCYYHGISGEVETVTETYTKNQLEKMLNEIENPRKKNQ